MTYYMYMAPDCPNCGKDQGMIEVNGGRRKTYCSDACRKAASRKRKAQAIRDIELRRNTELRDMWNEANIHDQLRDELTKMLFKHGKAATVDATKIVVYAQYLAGR